jgi:isopentenyldiphosphate isomerase
MTELFETFDDHGRPTGLVPRHEVHARGLWHRAVHVLLFTSDGRLHIQRRAASKDLYANCWDLSVGEHLTPGESYLNGAHRGLREELGVEGVALAPLGGLHRGECALPDLGILDRELRQTFRGVHDGPLTPDPEEVSAVDTVSLTDLATRVVRDPDAFTPWFRDQLTELQILPAAAQNKPS